MLSKAEEDYLKAIFLLELDAKKAINTNNIAEKLKTKASSVTDMLKKLALKNLVNYQKYKGVTLKNTGKKIATDLVRKHRLWETFLVKNLNFSWDEVHDVAEQLEHIQSDKLIANLDDFLDFPKQDPHGDPIPDKNGKMRTTKILLLSNGKLNKTYKISGIKNSSTSFLQYLDSLQININTILKVVKKMEFDNSLLILINNTSYTLSNKVCENLYIE